MYIILLGAPGAGKGTQAAMVAQEFKLVHIATGDLYREVASQETEVGRKVKHHMDRGELVPDELTIQMVTERLSAPDCEVGVVFDGFPRTLKQAKALDKVLAEQNKAIDKVPYLKVSQEELVKRLSRRWLCRRCQTSYHIENSPPEVWGKCDKCGGKLYQRKDDKPEIVRKRLEVYFRDTAPLTDYYAKLDKLVEVNGEGKVDEVSKRIVAALHSSLAASYHTQSSN